MRWAGPLSALYLGGRTHPTRGGSGEFREWAFMSTTLFLGHRHDLFDVRDLAHSVPSSAEGTLIKRQIPNFIRPPVVPRASRIAGTQPRGGDLHRARAMPVEVVRRLLEC